jgi:hypothetical protein
LLDPSNVLTLAIDEGGNGGDGWAVDFLTVGVGTAHGQCTPPPPDMVSWWPGDGSANDIEDDNNGTPQNGATFASGLVDQAFSFDGTAAEVDVPHNTNQNTGSQMTIDAWVNPSSSALGRPILNKRHGTSAEDQLGGYTFETNGSDNSLDFAIWIGGTIHQALTPANVLTNGTWQHVAATYDGTIMTVFVNGVVQASTPASGAIDATTDPLVIGRNLIIPEFDWDGLIDEVELFNRALSQPEIQAIVDARSFGKCKTPVASVAASRGRVREGASSTYTVLLSPKPQSNLRVNFSLSGTAVPGTDYTLTGAQVSGNRGRVTIPAGQSAAMVRLNATNDGVTEGTESAVMTLDNGNGYAIGDPGRATVRIFDP